MEQGGGVRVCHAADGGNLMVHVFSYDYVVYILWFSQVKNLVIVDLYILG